MSKEEPLISIIVPCYNVEKYLRKCVDSILNQTYRNLEVILVDDGSTDSTPQMCDEYQKQDERVKVIHKKNGGLVPARNSGFAILTGKWFMHVDGDDWIDEETCQGLMEVVRMYDDVDIVFWKCIQELGTKSIKDKWGWSCKDDVKLYTEDECRTLALNTLIYKSGIASSYCKLINADFAKKFGIAHDKRIRQGGEGLEFSLRAFYYSKKALFINKYYNHYRYNADSISKRIDEQNTKHLTRTFSVIEEDIEGFENNEIFREAFYQRVVYMLIAIAMSTYFHPNNKDSIFVKCRKYKEVIYGNKLYSTAIKKARLQGIDKFRKITLIFIRLKAYFMLNLIAKMKQYYLKKGKYNY